MKTHFLFSLQLPVFSIFFLGIITFSHAANQLITSNYQTGVTLTQHSLDPWGDSQAVSSGKELLDNSTSLVVQHVHGFGGVFPRLENGEYDWQALDNRFHNALEGVDHQVLTACCAPAYMEDGPDPGDFSPYLRPKTTFFALYAETVVQAVQRYPEISHIQVWNEMKGFWNIDENRWDYEAYTQLYNAIWDAVKAVRPDIQIGGPYVVLNSNGGSHSYNSNIGGSWGSFDSRDLDVVLYWLKNKRGADFITVDGKNKNKDGVELVDQFERTRKFGVFMEWLRGLDNSTYPGATTLPVWWAEWYARTDNDSTASSEEKNATMATGLIRTLRSGAHTAIIWGPQGDQEGNSYPLGLFSDTRTAGGGIPTLFYSTQKYLHDHFSSGTTYEDLASNNDQVEMLMSNSNLLLVNMTDIPQTTTIRSKQYSLEPYEVRLEEVWEPASPDTPIGLRIHEDSASQPATLPQ